MLPTRFSDGANKNAAPNLERHRQSNAGGLDRLGLFLSEVLAFLLYRARANVAEKSGNVAGYSIPALRRHCLG
jgi:hypothetical protein